MGTREKIVKTTSIPICDKCGCDLSDGSRDGGGGQTFWGQYLEMGKAQSIEAKLKPETFFRGFVTMELGITIAKDYYVLCDDCAQKVVDFIKQTNGKK